MRSLLAPLLLVAALRAQTSAVVDALATGNYEGAFAMLEQNMAPQEPTLRLRAVTLLARTPATPADRHERALRWAAQILPHDVPSAQSAELRQLAGDIGHQLTALLLGHRDALVDGRVADRTMLGAGLNAYQALRIAGKHQTQDTILLALHMAPLLFASDRSRDVVPMATDALEATPAPAQAIALHGFLGRSLLLSGRAEAALPHLRQYVAGDPSNASVVLPLARELPSAMAKDTAKLLQAVIGQRPSEQTQLAWTECLDEFYGLIEKHGAKKLELPSVGTTRLPMPQVWQQSLWGQGFRVFQDPNVRPSKIASGKDGLILPVPFSNGWRQRNRPPEELQRWQNCAYCLQRGADGPTLVVYWFGPNLEYWYGDTPVERGVTGKTVRGHSAGAIARFVWDTAYGDDAKARQVRYAPHAAPNFALAVGGQRKTFAVGNTVFDETVFSHGQVSVSVLLRATERQLAELEPELRWIYRTIAKD